jgi:hypothetical protein
MAHLILIQAQPYIMAAVVVAAHTGQQVVTHQAAQAEAVVQVLTAQSIQAAVVVEMAT